jgi:hypothetical protein
MQTPVPRGCTAARLPEAQLNTDPRSNSRKPCHLLPIPHRSNELQMRGSRVQMPTDDIFGTDSGRP